MNSRTQHKWTWRTGILFVVTCLIVGALLSFTIQKAQATCLPQKSEAATAKAGCTTAQVSSPKNGVRKYNNNQLGHFGRVIYSAKAKRVITNKLMAAQARQARHGRATTSLRRAGMWANFTENDTCAFRASSGSPNTAVWTCNGPASPFPDDADWDGEDVDAILCGGSAGIAIGGTLIKAMGGPVAWFGIGAGFVVCQWGDNWKRKVE